MAPHKHSKRGLPNKTHRPGKDGINQRSKKETKDNPEVVLGFTEEWPEKKPLLKE